MFIGLTVDEPPRVEPRRGITLAGTALLAEDERLYLAPIGEDGSSTGQTIELGSSASPPALSLPSTLSESGRYRIVPSSQGIVWLDRSSGATRLIAWPPSVRGQSKDLAVSPRGTRLAVLFGSQVHLARLDAAAAPEAPGGTQPATKGSLPAPPEPPEDTP
jgi:hypothetical protein